MTSELEQLILNLRNAAYENGTLHPWPKPQTKQFNADTAREASIAAEKALLDYLDVRQSAFTKLTEEGFGQLVSELIKRTHECALAPDGYGCDAYLAQVAAEKRLLEYVEKRERELAKLRDRMTGLAERFEERSPSKRSPYKVAAIKLRALLK